MSEKAQETLSIQVNGAARAVPAGTSLAALVRDAGLAPEQVAVEVNRQLVPRESRDERLLREGDRVELVTMVGGG